MSNETGRELVLDGVTLSFNHGNSVIIDGKQHPFKKEGLKLPPIETTCEISFVVPLAEQPGIVTRPSHYYESAIDDIEEELF